MTEECTEASHVLASIDATACRCGEVIVTERGIALAADPERILRPTAIVPSIRPESEYMLIPARANREAVSIEATITIDREGGKR